MTTATAVRSMAPAPRLVLFLALIVAFALVVGIGAAVSGAPEPRLLYLVCLFALCASPIIDLDSLNGRLALLGCFMLVYFVFFGVGDLMSALTGAVIPSPPRGAITETEAVILTGGLMLLLGYRWALRVAAGKAQPRPAKDWPEAAVVIIGLAMFAVGTAATWYLYVYVMPDKNFTMSARLAQVDPLLIALLLIGNLVLPFGIIVLAYAYAAYRRKYMLPMILAVVAMQALTGFVTDVKADAMKAAMIVILTKVLIDGRLPKFWVAGGVLFVVFGFPVLQAFRSEVIGAQGMNHVEVVQNLGRAFELAWNASDKVMEARGEGRQLNFFERASMKGSVELAVTNLGNGVDYQYGRTMLPLLTAFVPRLLMPGKTHVASGRLYGAEFNASNYTDTYISPTHLGEFYWNFGWPGAAIGMLGLGFLLGFINAKCDLTQFRSVTRLLILGSAAHLLIWGFEQTVATNYVVWMRGMAVIALLHLLLARVPAARGSGTWTGPAPLAPAAAAAGMRRFPNLLT